MPHGLNPSRLVVGILTLWCVVWHVLYAPMVNMGWLPALYAMPNHCRTVTLDDLKPQATSAQHHHHTPPHAMHDAIHDAMPHAQHADLDAAPHTAHTLLSHAPTSASVPTLHATPTNHTITQWQLEAFNLATEIMQLCPFCSLGVAGLLLPFFVLLLVVFSTKIRRTQAIAPHIGRIWLPHFIKFFTPPRHAPPVVFA